MSYRMKEMNEKTGISAKTLRYYEKEGILHFVERDENGKSIYNDTNIEWISFMLDM